MDVLQQVALLPKILANQILLMAWPEHPCKAEIWWEGTHPTETHKMRHLLRFRMFVVELFNEHLVSVAPRWIEKNVPAESDYCKAVHERWIEQYGGPYGCTPEEYQIMMNAVIGGGDAVCDLAGVYCLDVQNVIDWVEFKVTKEEALNYSQSELVVRYLFDANCAIHQKRYCTDMFDFRYPPWPQLTGMYMDTNPVAFINYVCAQLIQFYYRFVFGRSMHESNDAGYDTDEEPDDRWNRISHMMRDSYEAFDYVIIPDESCKNGYRRQFRYLNDIDDYLKNLSEYRAGSWHVYWRD